MELDVKLEHTDYLTYQLFTASMSKRIQKRRKFEWLLSSLFFLILALIFLMTQILLMFYYFVAVTILCLIFYPAYSRRRYKKHYSKHLQETFSNNFGKNAHIKFTVEEIETSDTESELKIKITQIKDISEITSHFFIHLIAGSTLIIPKKNSADDDGIRNYLLVLCNNRSINYNTYLNWKWK